MNSLPRLIWSYWHQGFDRAPYVVRECIKQLQALHGDWEIRLLDQYNVDEWLDPIPVRKEVWGGLCLPHRSDLIRTRLLLRYGGVWLDPTVYCVEPLGNWLPQNMAAGLFLFHRPGRDRIIANWFIAAEKDNDLLRELYQQLLDYWNRYNFRNLGSTHPGLLERLAIRIINNRSLVLSQIWLSGLFTRVLRIYPYMVYHYWFYRLINQDTRCRSLWQVMPKMEAADPLLLGHQGLDEAITPDVRALIDRRDTPLFKLKWKVAEPGTGPLRTVDYLFASAPTGRSRNPNTGAKSIS